eukprot:gnl/Dysnectes_brevis/4465_a6014_452.p1 GENE.gnl/Dysnectes_brevis/4465_a6014_452~~gnl/Dysnectes_brevis/4465_a6014_452.p1  ORF type:complete len:393 (-),score=81.02 gnl/Dysnectes_brevis/4465_a6014_452:37-1215(-)
MLSFTKVISDLFEHYTTGESFECTEIEKNLSSRLHIDNPPPSYSLICEQCHSTLFRKLFLHYISSYNQASSIFTYALFHDNSKLLHSLLPIAVPLFPLSKYLKLLKHHTFIPRDSIKLLLTHLQSREDLSWEHSPIPLILAAYPDLSTPVTEDPAPVSPVQRLKRVKNAELKDTDQPSVVELLAFPRPAPDASLPLRRSNAVAKWKVKEIKKAIRARESHPMQAPLPPLLVPSPLLFTPGALTHLPRLRGGEKVAVDAALMEIGNGTAACSSRCFEREMRARMARRTSSQSSVDILPSPPSVPGGDRVKLRSLDTFCEDVISSAIPVALEAPRTPVEIAEHRRERYTREFGQDDMFVLGRMMLRHVPHRFWAFIDAPDENAAYEEIFKPLNT